MLPCMSSGAMNRILQAIEAGDSRASAELLPLVYDELRRLADSRLANEQAGQTLQATALVHEAYLRLVSTEPMDGAGWDGRAHFFAAAAEAMRRILIDRAREKGTIKRGGGLKRIGLDAQLLTLDTVPAEVLDLDEVLSRLAVEDPAKAKLVNLRFFGGMTLAQAAAALGISEATADRHWAYARAWLFNELSGKEEFLLVVRPPTRESRIDTARCHFVISRRTECQIQPPPSRSFMKPVPCAVNRASVTSHPRVKAMPRFARRWKRC
ncbi:hypothetical protein BH09PLA1_BH09PLA1_33360 [soil metagenome]